ncbi:hypothetical protein [Microbacterium sp. G2-8]|uniref:hypothetical protein n=1 Tax=Microbacterium sp. G2-8 TaxID=2842454 RepID=UPI001C8993AC|nr:hypothetical protein [Microbacterium sp. G2-8]
MGSSKRYPDHAARLAEERELRDARKHGDLHTLSTEQLALHSRIVSIVPEHRQLRALTWLRFGDADVRATVRVRRWTETAVGVEVDVDGERLRCWVWRGACAPTGPMS